jgi:hypothetical protein
MAELGDRVQDKITKQKGIVVAKTHWLNGCTRLTVQPEELKDGKPVEASCFDEPQLVILKKNAVEQTESAKEKEATKRPHGDRNDSVALKRN